MQRENLADQPENDLKSTKKLIFWMFSSSYVFSIRLEILRSSVVTQLYFHDGIAAGSKLPMTSGMLPLDVVNPS